ncbi:MAG: DUF1499 domain-containing protein [Betaproteobacteria bacterium]
MKLLKRILIAVMVLALALIGAGQSGLLAGSQPASLGVHDGRLAPPAMTPNSVSSQADLYPGHPQREHARIAPLAYSGDRAAAMARLVDVIRHMDGAHVVSEKPDYLYAQFQTRWLGFVDDVEFWQDPVAGAIQVRSASRLGKSDLGENRRRIEEIRLRFKP